MPFFDDDTPAEAEKSSRNVEGVVAVLENDTVKPERLFV